jgi:type 2 lantibiotic biosynthesis protein LanM
MGTSSDLATWSRATTLIERILVLQEVGNNGLASQEISERAQRRMERWRSQLPFGTGDLFNQRLAADGLTEERLLCILNESEESQRARTAVAPEWLTDIIEAFSSDELSCGALVQQISLEPETSDESQKGLQGFLVAVLPLVSQGLARLHLRVRTLQQTSSSLPFEPADLAKLFVPALLQRLFQLLSRTLVLELNVARLQGHLTGDTERERFTSFVERLRDREVALALLEEYPVLARQVWQCINQWVDSTWEFLERLAADAEKIKETFCPDGQLGVLDWVNVGAGDHHRNGRSVTIIGFGSGLKLVYKPRSLDIEAHFQRLLEWLNQKGNHPPFKTLGILNQDMYGWVEFVAAKGCTSKEELQRFFQRQGGYLGLLYALEAVDCHLENLIACGEHPILVDLESLLHPRTKFEGPAPSPTDITDHSVLRVGILPRRFWVSDKSDGVDLSALGGVEGQLSPRPSLYLEGIGTDLMRVSHKHVPLPGGQNRPSLNDEAVDVLLYADDIMRGFAEIYHLLIAHRDELLAENGPIAPFAEDEVRVILRPTQLYALFLQDSFHPDFLRDALDRERLFDRLWVGIEDRPYLSRVIPCEREDLWKGDVPMFTTQPSSCDLWSSAGSRIEDFFKEPAISAVWQCISQLDEHDLERQLWFIRASLTALVSGEGAGRHRGYEPFQPKSSPEGSSFLEAAIDVGNHLEDLTFQAQEDISWVGVGLQKDRLWSLQLLGVDLYEGMPGIALFLGYLGLLSRQHRYTELAERTIATSIRRLEQTKSVLQSIGGFSGWGGAIYAMTHLGCLWKRPDLLERAYEYVELIPELILGDKSFDVMSGSAGCIGSLLGLYRITSSRRALEIATQCGDHLLAHAHTMEHGIGWVQEGLSAKPLTGFSHGNAGIAWALLQLSSVNNQERYRTAALDALSYERSLFSATARNWPDLRDPGSSGEPISSNRENFMTAWCHGASGIGFSRLKSLGSLNTSEFREDIDVALQTTLEQGFGGNHSLCHGDLGNLDFILEASRILDKPLLDRLVNQLSAMVLESVGRYGWLSGVPLNVETPGLMTGLAGIGYEMLRLASPSEVPSVLMMEPPRPLFTPGKSWDPSRNLRESWQPVDSSHRVLDFKYDLSGGSSAP